MYWIQHTQNGDKDGKALYKSDRLINEIKMVAKILESVKKCLILVVNRLRQNTMIIQVNNLLEK